ncbi:hypothetical protein ACHAWF_010280, partial [Thalassiosira exigua]
LGTGGGGASRPSSPPRPPRRPSLPLRGGPTPSAHRRSASSLRTTSGDGTGDPRDDRPIRGAAAPREPPWSPLAGSLLDRAVARAARTLSANSDFPNSTDRPSDDRGGSGANVADVLDAAVARSSAVLDGALEWERSESEISAPRQNRDKGTYLANPGVTPTALAHSLWRSAVLPGRDTVIDATCGNGKDCLALARMLFPESEAGEPGADDADEGAPRPELVGIDVQSRAMENTRRSLLSSLPAEVYYNRVTLLEQSHERLTDVPRDPRSVGLVCYNLGYLPGAPPATSSTEGSSAPGDDYKECRTQTETTLSSITDASLLLRVGGLFSVLTYPGTNLEESVAVERFVEGLAMLTTRDPGGWRGYVEGIPDGERGEGRTRALVGRALERVVAEGANGQTWRAFVHRPLGRPLSPVLVTATRIK